MSRVPLLHVLGAGPWQVATIRRARALGFRVLASDGFADRPGFAEADIAVQADITDAEATLAVARAHAIDGVLCDTTDTGVLVAAQVADALGLPGIGVEAALNCTDKSRMTEAARRAGLNVPASQRCETPEQALEAAQAMGAPWVVKPVDNQSGRGVSIVHEPTRLAAAIEQAFARSRRGVVLVQHLESGVEVIVDSIVYAGAVHVLGVARKTPYADNPTVSSAITYGTQRLPLPVATLVEANRALVRALGVRQGLVHAEYILGERGPVPIDVGARGGGVLIYPVVLPHVSGVDAMRTAIDLALGRPVQVTPRAAPRAAHIEFLRVAPGVLHTLDGVDDARAMPGIAALHLNRSVGERIGVLTEKDERLGFVVALADDEDQASRWGRAAAARISIHMGD
jgi:biotin carboxylase